MNFIFKIKKLLKEDFFKSILTVMGGSTFSLLLPIVGSLWLVKLYDSASDFSPFALFISFCYTIAAFSNSHYTSAILVADNDRDSIVTLRLTMLLNTVFAVLAYLLIVIFGNYFLHFLNVTTSFYYTIWLVPITVLLMGINAAFTQWAFRQKDFKRISINRVMQALVTITTQTFFGFYFKNFQGLIIGFFLGQLFSSILLASQYIVNDNNLLTFISRIELRQIAKKYNIFFRFQTPADIINVLTQQLPSFLLSKYATSPTDLAYYGNAYRLIVGPSSIITGAIGDVFRQKADSDYKAEGNSLSIFLKTAKLLFLIMIVPCLVVVFFGPWLFSFLFGAEWKESGVYAQILIIMMLPKFITSPLSYMYIIARKQIEDFWIHIYILISSFSSFYIGYKLWGTTKMMLILFCINYAIIYISVFFRAKNFAKTPKIKS